MSDLAEAQKQLKVHQNNLNEIHGILEIAPDNEDALEMQVETLAKIKEYEDKIAVLKPKKEAKPAVSDDPVQKWKKEDHPAFRKSAWTDQTPAVEETVSFNTGDNVMAKYTGDKGFYHATIVGAMGPVQNRIYTVRFKGYTGTETVPARDIRAIPSSTTGAQKRKADGSPVVPTVATPPSNNGSTMSAPANIDAELANAMRKEPSKVSDGPARPEKAPKKIRAKKELENSKNSWQNWQAKAGTSKAKKVVKKDSMFRTGESATAKVGFTGSGQGMRKDAARERNIYHMEADD